MTLVTGVVCEPPAQRDYPPEPAPPRRTQDALVRHHQPQQQQQQQHQPRQRNVQQQHAQTAHGSTAKTIRHNPADERDDGGAAIARPVVDEAAKRHKAARQPTGGDTNELQNQRRAQHNTPHTHAQQHAAQGTTVRVDPRDAEESRNVSSATGNEQRPADEDDSATRLTPTPTPSPTTDSQTTPTVRTQPAKNPDATPTANQRSQHMPAHFHRPASVAAGGASSRGSPATTVSGSQPSDAQSGGRWSAVQKTPSPTKAPG